MNIDIQHKNCELNEKSKRQIYRISSKALLQLSTNYKMVSYGCHHYITIAIF